MASATTVHASTFFRLNKPSSFSLPSTLSTNHDTPPLFLPPIPYPTRFRTLSASASKKSSSSSLTNNKLQEQDYEEVEEEEELPWIQEKALDLVEFTGSVTQALPGPRVGNSSFPWLLAPPVAYIGVSFVMAVVRIVKKLTSPKEKRRKLVNKNATLCETIDKLFEKGREDVQYSVLRDLMQKTGFETKEILRKYIRYALNEKIFDLNLVTNLIHLRKASMLDDSKVADIINDISTRIVKNLGPVVMDATGYSEKGFKRKLAIQALFGNIYYLSELPEFCSRDSSLKVKEIFGVTDEDAEKLRLHTVSEVGDVESLEKLVGELNSKDSPSNDSS